jgi:hypothetical protein
MRNASDPETKAKSKQLDFLLVILLLLVLGGVVFQFFLRYTYVHTLGNTVVRVDRISGDSCVLPCDENGYGPRTVAYVPPPTAAPAKVCHPANVVRVARALRPPVSRTPTPYAEGGRAAIPLARLHHWAHRKRNDPHAVDPRLVQYAVELTDGHVYSFTRDVFSGDVTTWTTGQDVQVCATLSKLEDRPYYSVGATDDAEPATLAL